MIIFDTHFHYTSEMDPLTFYDDILAKLSIAPQCEAGCIDRIFLNAVGGNYAESLRACEFAQQVETAFFSVGVHPHQAEEFLSEPQDFREFKLHPKLVAIGELGLDYYYGFSDNESQKQVFRQFLKLALEWNLPAIVHIRDQEGSETAYIDAYELLLPFAKQGGRFVIHCFAGTIPWAMKFLELGAYLGVTGIVTFRKADNVRECLKIIPDDRLLIETDSPYLAPVPHRGENNSPGFLSLIASRIAVERGSSLEEIAALTTRNAFTFFNRQECAI